MNEDLSRLMDGDLAEAEVDRVAGRVPAARGAFHLGVLPDDRRHAARLAGRDPRVLAPLRAGARRRADRARTAAQDAPGGRMGVGGGRFASRR